MGFFFATEKGKQEKGKKKNRNIQALNKFGCAVCPLNKNSNLNPKMQPTLAADTWIYWLGQNPGRQEDEQGSPFVGPSGKLLRHCIPDDILKHSSFDNIVRDRTPRVDNPDGGQKDRDPTPTEIEACRCLVTKSIEETKPKLIVGLGMMPQQWALNNSDQQGMRGRIFTIQVGKHVCYFMPTYHPARVLRSANDKDKGRRDLTTEEYLRTYLGRTFQLDIEKACNLVRNLDYPVIETESSIRKDVLTFNGKDQNGGLNGFMLKWVGVEKAKVVAIDIETQGLRPYSKDAAILSVAISYDDVNFSFALDHPQSKWTPSELKHIKGCLRDLLICDTIKVAHNSVFECEWLAYFFGKDAIRHEVWECTQTQAHFIDERRGAGQSDDTETKRATYQGLGFLVQMYFGVPFKQWFQLDKKNMAEQPLEETLIYNGADTRFTLRLWHRQNEILRTEGLHSAYLMAVCRQVTIALAQLLGMPVNQSKVKKLQDQLKDEISVIQAEIESLDVVRQYIKDKKEFKPLGDDALAIFRDYLKRDEIQIKDGNKVRWSIDKNILEKIDHPLAELIVKLRNKTKIKSTYVDGLELGKGNLVWPDGKIHCNFNSTFTTTGRTSCVAGWTPVQTIKGVVPIKKIKVGDLVLTHKDRYRKVLRTWTKGIGPMLEFILSNGEVLTCTKNHLLLLSSGRWIDAGDLYDLFKTMGIRSEKYRGSTSAISQQGLTISRGNSKEIKYTKWKCMVGDKESPFPRRAQSTENAEVLCIENGEKESHAWKNWSTASKMGRPLLRSQGVFDNRSQWEKNILSPLCNDKYSRNKKPTRWMDYSSYRWRSSEQSSGQSCISHAHWTQNYSLQGTGNCLIEIEEIKISGSFEIFDITVDEDSSYLSCGVYSHNSDFPNMQNFPSRTDSWVREQIEAPDRYTIVAADFGQLEMCGAAMASRDSVLVKALWDNYDTHMEWAGKLAKLCPERVEGDFSNPKIAKAFRSLIKNKVVFPAIYGATNKSMAGYLSIEQHYIDDLMDEFWDTFKGIKSWHKRLLNDYRRLGYVETLTGRRRNHPLTSNEAINSPIQGTASDIVIDAMNRLSFKASTEDMWHLHPILNIHDDLTFIVPDSKLEESIETIYKTMLYKSFDFINVPLSVEVKLGKDWFRMEEIGKFWSHEIYKD